MFHCLVFPGIFNFAGKFSFLGFLPEFQDLRKNPNLTHFWRSAQFENQLIWLFSEVLQSIQFKHAIICTKNHLFTNTILKSVLNPFVIQLR